MFILDTRTKPDFAKKHVPRSLNVPLNTKYEMFAGALIGDRELLLITEPGKEAESILRLSFVGVEKIKGFLKGGIDAWRGAFDSLNIVTVS